MNSLLIAGGTLWNGKKFLRGEALLLTEGIIAAAGPEDDVLAAAPASALSFGCRGSRSFQDSPTATSTSPPGRNRKLCWTFLPPAPWRKPLPW